MHRTSFAAFLTLLHLAVPSPAQQARTGNETNRATTSMFVSATDGEARAAVSIGYGRAVWRDRYDSMLGNLVGNYTRLGVGWWTTLDTIGPIEIGGTRIEPGSYFLGLAMTADHKFQLLVFASDATMKARMLPATTALYRGEFAPHVRAPLTFAKGSLPAVVGQLQIELSAERSDPTAGKLTMRWGKHELSAPLRLLTSADKAAAGTAK